MLARRAPLSLALVALFPVLSQAQAPDGRLQPITSPVKDAGTYHLSTDTWTRARTSTALAGPEVLYDNTCSSGYFTGLDANEIVGDSGRIPALASGGLYDTYEVNGFRLAYCTYVPGTISIFHAYWDCYAACDGGGNLTALTPVAAFSMLSLPAGGPAGSLGCWQVTFDLMNTTLAFNLRGDCNGTLDGNPSTDSFGWGFGMPASPAGTSGSGPFVAGDPAMVFNPSCGGIGDGTTFPGYNQNGDGTGIGQLDQYELQSLTVVPGCYWFGGYSGANGLAGPGQNPWSGFYLELQGDDGGTGCLCGGSICDCSGGNGPCGNSSGAGRGCPNSNPNGLGAALVGSGNPSISNDTFALACVDGPANKPGLLFAGTMDFGPNGLNSVPDSAGLSCVGGVTRRGSVVFTDATGNAAFPDFQGAPFGQSDIVVPGMTLTYTHWFRDPGTAAGCLNDTPTGSDFNFSNGWALMWMP